VPMTLMLSIVEHVLSETDFNTLAFIDRPPAMLLGYVWWSGLSQQFWSGWSKEGRAGLGVCLPVLDSGAVAIDKHLAACLLVYPTSTYQY